MSGKWNDPAVPHSGWNCVDVEDLEEPSAICEMCEYMEIRFVHVMEHPHYPDELRCGCICAGKMELDPAAARGREHALKLIAARRAKWLLRTWRTSYAGNEFLNTDGFHIVIFPHGKAWAGAITHRGSGKTLSSKLTYLSPQAVKLAALDAMLALKDKLNR